MSLIRLNDINIAFGHVMLLDHIALRLEKGERVCLIGRNGEGKSTLLKIISGDLSPDQGQIEYQQGCIVTRLSQEPVFDSKETVFNTVAKSLGQIGQWLEKYHSLVQELTHKTDEHLLAQLEAIQHCLEAEDGWRLEQRVKLVLSQLNLPSDQPLDQLSGGWQRRVALAQVLVTEPDLLILDEPTNHLDIEAITWLEETLLEWQGSLLFVSHDRHFMQRIATRVIELDRGQLSNYPVDYASYLRQKTAALEVETTQAAKFDKQLAQEEIWIRQGIKARRTRNQGRVQALKKLREQRAQRREQQGKIHFKLNSGELSGRIVIEANHISKNYQGLPLIQNFSTIILRGDKVGLIGPNGVGKTTLLKLLLGELQPDSGEVKQGTQLNIAYFDQLRAQLNPEDKVMEAVSQGQETLTINGQKKHVISYLSDFLFAPERAISPVRSLSGGERNRLLLARLFTQPANLLVLDEPTNDLDVESLELLEEHLLNYSGTLLLVSHDRQFLDNVVTSTFVFEGQGQVKEYVGGYQDWLNQCAPISSQPSISKKTSTKTQSTVPKPKKRNKLSYNEQRELAALPEQIEALEMELTALQALISQPNFYRGDKTQINQTLSRIKTLDIDLQTGYARWEELETLEKSL